MRYALAGITLFATTVFAQTGTPAMKVGGLIFADYTYAREPVRASSFNVTRAYVNVSGNLNRAITFRVTPDIARENGSGSSLAGSQLFRLKYAYAQLNANRAGTWLRLGMQPTPFMEFAEPIYRYRFQGPLFEDREGYESTSDSGIGGRAALPGRFDVQGGLFNGEGYSKAETNNEKSVQFRATWSPIAGSGLHLTGSIHDDHYLGRAARQRLIAQAAYSHPRFAAAVDILWTKDQKNPASPEIDGRGFTAFVTPKLGRGWEALLRRDEIRPDTRSGAKRKRDIEGIAYWPRVPKGISAAILIDRDATRGIGERTTHWGLKMMIGF